MTDTLYLHRPGMGRTAAVTGLRPAAWAASGAVAGALLALLVFAPARWLAKAVYRATGQQLLLADPRGTVWNGSARLMLTGGADSREAVALPERVQWTLTPGFTGLHAGLHAACCTPRPLQLRIVPRLSGWRVDVADAQVQWPAGLLAGLGTPWNTLQPSGLLSLQTSKLSAEWNNGRLLLAGGAVLDARDMASPLSTLRPLGTYRLRLQGGTGISATLETLEGGLQLSGSGQWIGSRLRFSGEASALPEREAALTNLLNIIGRRDGSRSIITIG